MFDRHQKIVYYQVLHLEARFLHHKYHLIKITKADLIFNSILKIV